jgi:type IV pilus assembly protein PilM
MAANRAVWGIDLGQCALKAIRIRAAGDKVEVVDHVYIEHPRILSQPDADRPALVAEAMKKFTAGHDLSKELLIVSVPGQNTLARFTKLPPVPKKSKIPELVKYEAQQQIPFDMEEVIWDYQIFEDPKGMDTQVGIFAMRRELLRSHLSFLSDLNLEPALVQSSPLALYNALKFDGVVGAEPLTILDIGAQNTDLIVVDGDSLWTRNIPIGGNNFTDALLKTFKLSFNKAENLKRTAGSSKYARQIFQAMRPVFADLVAEVQRSIGFFTSSRRGVKLDKLVAMGNAFKLPGMVKFVQQNLGMDVIRPTSFNRLAMTETPNAPELIDQLLSYGVAYGLALQGLGKAQITSNLLPPEIAKQVIWRKKTPWFYGAAACLAAAAAMVWAKNLSDNRIVSEARANASQPQFQPTFDPADKEQKHPQPNRAAIEIVERGPSASTPLGQAMEVSGAAQHLDGLLSQVQSENDTQLQKVDSLLKLQSQKTVWPRILHMIHAALPKMDDEFEKAMQDGAPAVRKLIEANPQKYERGKREKILVDKFEASFSLDVFAAYNAAKSTRVTASGGAANAAAPTPPVGGPKPGFVITMRGRTPFQGRGPTDGGIFFVNNTFLNALRKMKPQPGVYLDCIGQPLWQTQVKTFKTEATGAVTGGAQAASREGEKDPLTDEVINDTEFEVMFVAVLGDKPPETPGAAAPAGPNG